MQPAKKKKRVKRKRRTPAQNLAHAKKMLIKWEKQQDTAGQRVRTWRREVAKHSRRLEKENAELRARLAERVKPKRRIVL